MAISKKAQAEFNMKPGAFKVLLLSSAVAGLAGMAGTISAQTFNATATVQNAVTITQVTPLHFGTVFATRTNTGSSATEDNTWSRKLTLSPAGAVSAVASSSGSAPQMLSLGGATAGQYSAPGLPSNGSVGIGFLTADGSAFSNSTETTAACAYDTPALAVTGDKIVMQNGADPTTGFFCVDAFTSNRTGLMPVGVTPATGYALGFGITTLTFDLGATLVAQAPTTDALQRQFAAGSYTGSFQMEVTFP